MLADDAGQNFPGSPQFWPRITLAKVIHSPPSLSRLPIAHHYISCPPIDCTPISCTPISCTPISCLPIPRLPIGRLPFHNPKTASSVLNNWHTRGPYLKRPIDDEVGSAYRPFKNVPPKIIIGEHCKRLRDYGHLLVLANRASHPCWRPSLRTRSENRASHPCWRPFLRMRSANLPSRPCWRPSLRTRSENRASRPCRRPFFRMRSVNRAGHPCWRPFLRMRLVNPASRPCRRPSLRMRSAKNNKLSVSRVDSHTLRRC